MGRLLEIVFSAFTYNSTAHSYFVCQTDDGTSKRVVISSAPTLRVSCFVSPPACCFVMWTSNV
jgi:hypothetical protein